MKGIFHLCPFSTLLCKENYTSLLVEFDWKNGHNLLLLTTVIKKNYAKYNVSSGVEHWFLYSEAPCIGPIVNLLKNQAVYIFYII